jgi:type IV pilus assembly protein PilA
MCERLWRRRREAHGFSLIELMIVVLIIGILIAIALPAFLGARTRAENRAAQSELRSALVAANTYFSDDSTYTNFDVAAAQAIEGGLRWVAGGGPPLIGEIAIEQANGANLLLITRAKTLTYWCVAQVPGSPLTVRGGDANWNLVNAPSECNQGW